VYICDVYRGVWSPGQASMFKDLPRTMQEDINMHDIYATLVQVVAWRIQEINGN